MMFIHEMSLLLFWSLEHWQRTEISCEKKIRPVPKEWLGNRSSTALYRQIKASLMHRCTFTWPNSYMHIWIYSLLIDSQLTNLCLPSVTSVNVEYLFVNYRYWARRRETNLANTSTWWTSLRWDNSCRHATKETKESRTMIHVWDTHIKEKDGLGQCIQGDGIV